MQGYAGDHCRPAPVRIPHAWDRERQQVRRLGFGKYASKTLLEVYREDRSYCQFMERVVRTNCVLSRLTVVRHLNFRTLNKKSKNVRMDFHRLPPHVQQYVRFPSRKEEGARCLLR